MSLRDAFASRVACALLVICRAQPCTSLMAAEQCSASGDLPVDLCLCRQCHSVKRARRAGALLSYDALSSTFARLVRLHPVAVLVRLSNGVFYQRCKQVWVYSASHAVLCPARVRAPATPGRSTMCV